MKLSSLSEFQRKYPLDSEALKSSIIAQHRITANAVHSSNQAPNNRYLFGMAKAEIKLLGQLQDQATYG